MDAAAGLIGFVRYGDWESMKLPAGMVTFLFTDIEGSASKWDTSSDEMTDALHKHDGIIDAAVEQSGGAVVKKIGDGYMAVFRDPARAVEAAVEAQVSISEAMWPELVGPISVRVGIHTGPGDPEGGDYLGPSVNRAARLEAAGHGGQVLVSAATRELVGDRLGDVAFRDLGEHQLRGLSRPERVYQILEPRLPEEFPPLRTETAPTNLPAVSEHLIGRADELEALKKVFEHSRLVTITGAGGVGKTTLAVEVARSMVGSFKSGVWLLELAPLSDGRLIAGELLGAMRRAAPADREPDEVLFEVLSSQRALLLLDNSEHLIEDVAGLVDRVLRNAPNVSVLTTSREPLGLRPEHVWTIPTMSLPEADDLDAVSASDAGALFMARATEADHQVAFDDSNAHVVAEICRRLDGLPLAIELAAARLRSMGLDELNDRLDDRFKLLRKTERDAMPHHQRLRDTVAWSYDLLKPEQKMLYRRLSIFTGGFDLEAAEAIGGGDVEVLDGLDQLVGQSLIEVERGPSTRYRMLQTIREFGEELLVESSEYERIAASHLAWVASFTKDGARGIEGKDQLKWLARFRSEIDNIRQALGWAVGNDPVIGAKVVSSLSRFFWMYAAEGDSALMSDSTSFLREGYEWSVEMLNSAGDDLSDNLVGRLQLAIGGLLCVRLGRYEEALQRLEEAATIFGALGDERNLGWSAFYRSIAGFGLVDLDESIALMEEALSRHKSAGDQVGAATSLLVLGTFRSVRSAGSGRAQIEQFAAGVEDSGSLFAIAHANDALAFDDVLIDRVTDDTKERVAKALELFRRANNYACLCHAVGTAAGVLVRFQDFEGAARALGLTETIRDRLSMASAPYERRDPYVMDIRGDYGAEGDWAAAQTEGQTLEPDEGIDWVITRLGHSPKEFDQPGER